MHRLHRIAITAVVVVMLCAGGIGFALAATWHRDAADQTATTRDALKDDDLIFEDGFESGDLSAWSAPVFQGCPVPEMNLP